jgi:hypothetical protein
METPGAASQAIESLRLVLRDLDDKYGELAEVRKAENQAYHDGWYGANVTECREAAKRASATYYREAIDLQADIDSLHNWRNFYTLIIQRGD